MSSVPPPQDQHTNDWDDNIDLSFILDPPNTDGLVLLENINDHSDVDVEDQEVCTVDPAPPISPLPFLFDVDVNEFVKDIVVQDDDQEEQKLVCDSSMLISDQFVESAVQPPPMEEVPYVETTAAFQAPVTTQVQDQYYTPQQYNAVLQEYINSCINQRENLVNDPCMEAVLYDDVHELLDVDELLATIKEEEEEAAAFQRHPATEPPLTFQVQECYTVPPAYQQNCTEAPVYVPQQENYHHNYQSQPEYGYHDINVGVSNTLLIQPESAAAVPPAQHYGRHPPQRNKSCRWTVDEHKRFLIGLKECGANDWVRISNKYVKTRSAIQIASHNQKYTLRHQAKNDTTARKKRSSILDITLADLSPTELSSIQQQ